VAQVIGAELRFETIRSMAKWCGHHSSIGDHHVKGLVFRQQSIGAGAHALQVGKIKLD
jgi:hypothetical protein